MAYKPTFVLEEELDELSFDFRTKKNPDAAHGVIPEPTTQQLQRFQRKLKAIMAPVMQTMAQAEKMSPDERLALALAPGENEDETAAKHRESLQLVADLCSDCPSVEDIAGLPHRAQQVFVGWVAGVFMDPEAQMPVSTQ